MQLSNNFKDSQIEYSKMIKKFRSNSSFNHIRRLSELNQTSPDYLALSMLNINPLAKNSKEKISLDTNKLKIRNESKDTSHKFLQSLIHEKKTRKNIKMLTSLNNVNSEKVETPKLQGLIKSKNNEVDDLPYLDKIEYQKTKQNMENEQNLIINFI